MNGIDLIIFDCDGVLVDSEIIASEVEAALLTEAGYPISAEEMAERFAGMTWQNTLLQIEKEASIPLSASLISKVDTILDERLARDLKIIEGVKPMLAQLTLPHCICSNSTSARLAMMLGKVGIKDHFGRHIYSARDLGADRVKPKPDIFLHGAKQMGVAPSAHPGHRGLRSRHPWSARSGHARRRLHRRLAHPSLACRPADRCRRRNGDFAHVGAAGRDRRSIRVVGVDDGLIRQSRALAATDPFAPDVHRGGKKLSAITAGVRLGAEGQDVTLMCHGCPSEDLPGFRTAHEGHISQAPQGYF